MPGFEYLPGLENLDLNLLDMKNDKLKLKIVDFQKINNKPKRKGFRKPETGADKKVGVNIPETEQLTGDRHDPWQIRTKRRILRIVGDSQSNPELLDESVNLRTNLFYSNREYSLLRMSFDALIKEYDTIAGVSRSEVNDCSVVGDCIKLVGTKIRRI